MGKLAQQFKLFVVLILNICVDPALAAYQIDVDCAQNEATAQAACSAEDLSAGMTDGGARAQQLKREIDRQNQAVYDRSSPSRLNSLQAYQCQNQANLSRNLSELSTLKAQACQRAASNCMQKCTQSDKNHRTIARVLTGIDDEDADLSRELAKKGRVSSARCSELTQKAQMARQEAEQLTRNAAINQLCHEKSSNLATTGNSVAHESVADPNADGQDSFGSPTRPVDSSRTGARTAVAGAVRDSSTIGGRGVASLDTQIDPEWSGDLAGDVTASGAPGTTTDHRHGATFGHRNASGAAIRGGGAGPKTQAIRGIQIRDPRKLREGVLGMSIQAKDGITGPLGLSLFEKVSKQYQRQLDVLINE